MATAISYDHFGGPEVLTLTEIEAPEPGPGQVQLDVRAAGVNLVDAKLRRGDLAHVFTPQFPVIPGLEVAGVVTALGAGVDHVVIGDAVFGVAATGGYAQVALAGQVVRKPEPISWQLAAALPIIGEAAFRALGHLHLQPGERLLIHGGAGSVGSIATQVAVSRGITVIATASSDDLDYVESLGALAISYGDHLLDRVRALQPGGADAVLDTSGAGVLAESVKLAGGPQRVITIADETAAQHGVRFTGPDPADRDQTALAQLADLTAAGRLQLRVWRSYPLSESRQAHTDLDAHRNHGKIVLLP
jgi:NADPH:quinone reductase-like Zn-dependent oxidoreductase